MTPAGDAGGAGPAPDLPAETIEELYDGAPCGYLTTHLDGRIARVNRTFLDWTGYAADELVGRRHLADLLTAGGRIYHETHYAPLLRMQGEVHDIALDVVRADGRTLPVVLSSEVREGPDGAAPSVRTTVLDATVRHAYERELLAARRRAEESEARVKDVALVLQRSLMQGGLSEGPGFTVETRYRPAVETLEVGGDWYDAFLLPDGRTLAISVGDVVGRGITAAAAMGQIRSALRAIAGTGVGPGPVLDELDSFVTRVPDAWMATVAVAEVDLAAHRARFACAGHLPPLLVHPDGRSRLLWDGRSAPLAAFPRADPRPEDEVVLDAGDRLLLYTDGLIERRDRDIDAGLDLLVAAATELRARPPAEMVDTLVDRLLADEDALDDVCVLCVAFRDEGGAEPVAAPPAG